MRTFARIFVIKQKCNDLSYARTKKEKINNEIKEFPW